MSSIVGLGGSIHDFSACLLNSDGEFYCCEVERLIRKRYAAEFPLEHRPAVDLLLAFSKNPQHEAPVFAGDDMISLRHFPHRELTNHHDAHAAAAFFQSSFTEADILVIDGVGSSRTQEEPEERETVSFYVAKGNTLRLLKRVYGSPTTIRFSASTPRIRNNSLGDYYRFFTQLVGFGYLEAGKLMGLAPYGSGTLNHFAQDLLELKGGGEFEIFGKDSVLRTLINEYRSVSLQEGEHQAAADIACLAQYGIEKVIEHCALWLAGAGTGRNLCVAGGVAQNAIAMGRLPEVTKYSSFFVDNAPGDSGAALGSAVLAMLPQLDSEKIFRLTPNPFSHPHFDEDFSTVLERNKLVSEPCDFRQLASELARGKIVALFEGGAEFGARALGHRSILADARDPSMKDRLNIIKGREWFRPIAPCVLDHAFDLYFDSSLDCTFMQYIVPSTERARSEIPSGVHVDGSARAQKLTPSVGSLYSIVEEFNALTGVPVLLNTSFNIRGLPIVHTFADAVSDFIESKIDGLYFGGAVVWK